jgi:hypothetical protein
MIDRRARPNEVANEPDARQHIGRSQQIIADLRRELEQRTAERDESEAQKAALAEVLQVINASPGDLAPVFEAMLDRPIRLCEATHGHLFTYDGDRFHTSAARGDQRYIEWAQQAGPVRPPPIAPLGRIKHGERGARSVCGVICFALT